MKKRKRSVSSSSSSSDDDDDSSQRSSSRSHSNSSISRASSTSSRASSSSCDSSAAVPFRRAPDGRLFNIDDSADAPPGFARRVYRAQGIKGHPLSRIRITELIPPSPVDDEDDDEEVEDDDEEEDDDDEKMESASASEEEESGGSVDSKRKWDKAFETVRVYYKEKRDAWVASKRLRTREELSTDDLRDIANGQGDIRLANIYKLLEGWPVVRVSYQKYFHDVIIKSCLPQIYANEWESNQQRVLKEHGMEKIDYEVLVTTARRMGKTYAVSMLVCAFLMCVPGIQIIVVSTGGRASSSLCDTVIKFVEMSPGGKERIVKRNAEQLFIAAEGFESMSKEERRKRATLSNTSKLLCFPGNSTGKLH